MATTEFIESLNIEENVFELMEDTVISYLVHYAAPCTGGSEISVPAGTKFAAHGPMRGDALYMGPTEEYPTLLERMDKKEQETNWNGLAYRITGFSFYITEDEVKNLKLNFVSGSKERLLDIFELLRN